jgi:hypothetical protein
VGDTGTLEGEAAGLGCGNLEEVALAAGGMADGLADAEDISGLLLQIASAFGRGDH